MAVCARSGCRATIARRIARCLGSDRRALPGSRVVVWKLTTSAEYTTRVICSSRSLPDARRIDRWKRMSASTKASTSTFGPVSAAPIS